MTISQESVLSQLRSIEHIGQWNECRDMVRLLLPNTTEVGIVGILLRQIERFLTAAYKTYPADEDIPAEMARLVEVASLEALLASATSIRGVLEKHSCEPGINKVRNTLKRLLPIESIEPLSSDYYDAIVDALSGILMGLLDQQWGQNNLDLWSRWFWRKAPEDELIRARYFVTNPETIELNKELWGTVADGIEAGLVS